MPPTKMRPRPSNATHSPCTERRQYPMLTDGHNPGSCDYLNVTGSSNSQHLVCSAINMLTLDDPRSDDLANVNVAEARFAGCVILDELASNVVVQQDD